VHPEDGNAFAILAGLASPAEATSALAYLSAHESRPYGNSIAENDTWNAPDWGFQAGERVYPFISYYEALARYAAGLDASALELIRREWGAMATDPAHPGVWEDVGPNNAPTDPWPSWNAGWSTGAAAVLTEEVLGVHPTSPGFATFTVTPHPDDLTFARGLVPTPRGYITVSWQRTGDQTKVTVAAPPGEVWTNAR